MAIELINIEQDHKTELDVHKWKLQHSRVLNNHGDAKNQGDDGRGPGDDYPELFGHHSQLFAKNRLFRLRFIKSFSLVNEQPNNVKEAGKPGDNKDDV